MTDNKQRSEGEGKGRGKGKKGGDRTSSTTLACVMKFLTPEVLASGIIGKGGSVIAEWRDSCQARLGLTDHGEFYPSTDCRVFTAQSDEQEALNKICKQLVAKLVEISKGQAVDGVAEGAELKIRTLVPRAAVGGIIGKGGTAIKDLRESTSSKINIGDAIGSGPGAEQQVTIIGSPEALETVLKEVNKQIQSLNGESWYHSWASSTGTSTGGGSYLGSSLQMPYGRGNHGVDLMMRVGQSLPPYVMEDSRGFALSCVVPNRLVGGLIGRGGQGTKEVQTQTGTKIGIRDIPGDTENRSMNITGPLPNTCAAYMLMMKRYLDAESSAQSSGSAQS